MYTLLDTQDFIRVKQALGENNSIFNDPASLPYTDWPEEIYRDGIEHSYNLSLSGGSGKIRYYLAGAYERENGTQLESYWERISARLNVDYAVNKAVTVGTRIYFARTRTNPYTLSFPWVSIPYITVKNPDGSWTGVPSGVDTDAGNPRADIAKHHYKSSDLTGNADLYVDWNIWDGLTLNLTGSAHLGGGFDDNYSEASNLRRTPESDSNSKYLDYAEEYTFTSTLSYGKKFAGKHDFHVMAGFEAKNASYSYLASFSNVTLHSFDGSSAVAGYNIYFIRLPDIYLMYAELLAAEGRDAEALEYVNKVHRRAYGYDPDQASPVDYASLQDRTKTVDPEDHLADNPLLYERWAELFGEMRWWEDVRRLRLGAEEAGYYKTVSGPGAAKTNIVWKETNYAMPIPTSEFESNPSSGMVQVECIMREQ